MGEDELTTPGHAEPGTQGLLTLRAHYGREGSDWTVSVYGLRVLDDPDGPSEVPTWGRNLAEARRSAREVVAMHLQLPDDVRVDEVDRHVHLEEVYDLPGGLGDVAADIRRRRRELDDATVGLAEDTLAAARRLADGGCTIREVATLLGISAQRVAQLVPGGSGQRGGRPAARPSRAGPSPATPRDRAAPPPAVGA